MRCSALKELRRSPQSRPPRPDPLHDPRHVRIATRDLDAFIRAGRIDVGEVPTLRPGA